MRTYLTPENHRQEAGIAGGTELALLSIDELLERYQFNFENKVALYIPYGVTPEVGLVVAMSTHNFQNRYYFLKGLLSVQRCSLLFLTDPTNSYYLEDDQGAGYQRLLEPYVQRYGAASVTLFGSSMAGYGAIYHGTKLNTNVIASNPQINLEASYEYAWDDLKKTLTKAKDPVKLNEFIPVALRDTIIYLAYGDHPMDKLKVKLLLDMPLSQGRIYLQKLKDPDHGFYFKDPRQVFTAHQLLCYARNNFQLKR
jgi:hypothetical protein